MAGSGRSSWTRPLVRGWSPLAQRLRQSLFVLPALFVVAGAAMAEIAIRIDRADFARWLPSAYETSVVNARSVLAAVATGTITVVTLVLTLTLIAIQLAAGQLSPRTIIDYLEDRFQQTAIGIVLGTAAYSLAALRSLGPQGLAGQAPDVTVLVAFILTMISLLVLLASVDRMAGRLQVGNLIDNIADETCALILDVGNRTDDPDQDGAPVAGSDDRADSPADELESTNRPDSGNDHGDDMHGGNPDGGFRRDAGQPARTRAAVTALRSGWIQTIDESAMAAAVPEGSRLVILHQAGRFVYQDMIVVEVSDLEEPLDDEAKAAIAKTVEIGDSRSISQDVAFGLTRLVDIGLRALSPGINDPNTAREVILRLGQILLTLQRVRLPGPSTTIDGRAVDRLGIPGHDEFADAALDQLRLAADGQPAVLETMADTLRTVVDESRRRGYVASDRGLIHQLWLIERTLGRQGREPGPDSG